MSRRKTPVFISAMGFGKAGDEPLRLFRKAGCAIDLNTGGQRLTEAQIIERIGHAAVAVAGTEPYTEAVFAAAPALRLIVRIGVGTDTVDLAAARKRGIKVAFTPDAPARSVAELTIGLMLSSLRGISQVDRAVRAAEWPRPTGRLLSHLTVGLVGVGRVGSAVANALLGGFPGVKILGWDALPSTRFDERPDFRWSKLPALLSRSDIVSIHLPNSASTEGLINREAIARMKAGAILVNTARGPIIVEKDLIAALRKGRLAGAALDVFSQEPYHGPLLEFPQCLVTTHLGSMTRECRLQMEKEAAEEVARFVQGKPLVAEVPLG